MESRLAVNGPTQGMESKPIAPPPSIVASAILEHRHDAAALARLQEAGN
ncbi:hypothetical protein [Enterobacter cloacae]|nr:hypothetical protein [Enterobacter cloacae]